MRAVIFLKSAAPYNAGEIAGFDDAKVAQLVKSGVAEIYKQDKPKAKEDVIASSPEARSAAKPKASKAKGK